MKYLFLLPFLFACASGPTKLTDKARDIEVFAHKPVGCAVIGRVQGENDNGSKELALNDALNQAAEIDATGLFVNQEVPNGKQWTVYATAYQCN